MSGMLQQAIVDAEKLREAALQEAEGAALEKYAQEIKENMNRILEAPEDELGLDDEGEDDPLAGIGDDLGDLDSEPSELDPVAGSLPAAATEGDMACACPDQGEEIEIDFDELSAQAAAEEDSLGPDLELGTDDDELGALGEDEASAGIFEAPEDEEVTLPANLGVRMLDYHMSQDDPVYAVGSSSVANRPVSKSLVNQAFDNLESYLDKVEPQDRDDLMDILDQLQEYVPESGDDEGDMDFGELDELGIDASMLESILETLEVDQENVPVGHGLNPNTKEQEHAVDVAVAQAQGEEESEEREALLKSLDSVNEEKAKLEEQVRTLKESNNTFKSIAKKAAVKLKILNVENAKLHYMNRVLESTSLNERQKKVLVEALQKVDSVNGAKAIFETRETANGRKSLNSEKKPETLSEHVNRGNSLTVRIAESQKQGSESRKPKRYSRIQELAGLNK